MHFLNPRVRKCIRPNLYLAHRYNFHPPEYFRQLYSTTINARLNSSLGYPQQVDYFLVAQLFYVSQDHARS
jgi:hypothetical protein